MNDGKSADKAMGAYCTKHKKLAKEDGCEGCKVTVIEEYRKNGEKIVYCDTGRRMKEKEE